MLMPKQGVGHRRQLSRQRHHDQTELVGNIVGKVARGGKDKVGLVTQAGRAVEIRHIHGDVPAQAALGQLVIEQPAVVADAAYLDMALGQVAGFIPGLAQNWVLWSDNTALAVTSAAARIAGA